jgi:hypothetical protein
MNNLTILITPVANGFLVTLPFEVRNLTQIIIKLILLIH